MFGWRGGADSRTHNLCQLKTSRNWMSTEQASIVQLVHFSRAKGNTMMRWCGDACAISSSSFKSFQSLVCESGRILVRILFVSLFYGTVFCEAHSSSSLVRRASELFLSFKSSSRFFLCPAQNQTNCKTAVSSNVNAAVCCRTFTFQMRHRPTVFVPCWWHTLCLMIKWLMKSHHLIEFVCTVATQTHTHTGRRTHTWYI